MFLHVISKLLIFILQRILISLQGILHRSTFNRICILIDTEVIFWLYVLRVEKLLDCAGTVATIIEEAICSHIHTNNRIDVIV